MVCRSRVQPTLLGEGRSDTRERQKSSLLIDDQSIITQKWLQLMDCHRLALKNLGIPHIPACKYMHLQKCLRFEFVHQIVCMQLHGFKNQQQKHTLKQSFEETQVSLSCSSLSFILLMSGWYLGIFRNFLFFQQVLSTSRARWNH